MSSQTPGSTPSNADRGPTLVVLLHAYAVGPESLDPLVAAMRTVNGFETDAEAEFLVPRMPLTLLSLVDPLVIVNQLIEEIDARLARSGPTFARILLIGHSYGSLLARKLYVVACGETKTAPFEPAIHNRIALARNGPRRSSGSSCSPA